MRHYEAAQPGRRTQGWARTAADADLALRGAILELRMHSRDLIRNNAWARRAQRVIANNTVGWGLVPKATSLNAAAAKKAMALWKDWAETKECESEGRHTFYGIQNLAMKTIVESGEVLIRRRFRRVKDNLTIPLQLQVLEADHLDQNKNFFSTDTNGPTIQGVEFDLLGRRTAYWLYATHPGSGRNIKPSERVPADQILHVYYTERPGQTRGVSWLGAAIVPLKDFDGYEDATLMRQKIAACFAAFVTDMDGAGAPIALPSSDVTEQDPLVEEFQPGMIAKLPPGKDVKFGNPPLTTEDTFTSRTLRRIAVALGVTYEDLSGDYSQVNFSSARMSRISHYENVKDWRWNMLVPLLCDGVWQWAMEAAQAAGELPDIPVTAQWTAPPMPMIEPDKEGLAYQRLVRNGTLTHNEMIREQGGDPDIHWADYAEGLAKLDSLKITLDSDARKTTAAGQEQPSEAPAPTPSAPPTPSSAEKKAQRMLEALVMEAPENVG